MSAMASRDTQIQHQWLWTGRRWVNIRQISRKHGHSFQKRQEALQTIQIDEPSLRARLAWLQTSDTGKVDLKKLLKPNKYGLSTKNHTNRLSQASEHLAQGPEVFLREWTENPSISQAKHSQKNHSPGSRQGWSLCDILIPWGCNV